MSTPTLSIHESVRELLSTAQHSDDCAFLIPVIETLFNQLSELDAGAEQTYRQLISNLSELLVESQVLTDAGEKHFKWMLDFADSGHDANVLEALIQRFDRSLFKSPHKLSADTPPSSLAVKAQSLQAQAIQEEATQPTSTDALQQLLEVEDQHTAEPEDIDALPRELIETLTDTRQVSAQFHELIKDNQLADSQIKQLKETLKSRLDNTRDQFSEFEKLMQLLLTDLHGANNLEELDSIRNMLHHSVNNLLSEQQTISGNILDVARELDQLENHCIQLNQELGLVKRLSMTDELTRLPNRRAFLKRLQNESGRVQRYGYPLSIAMIDLDLFKEINDTYGHAIGDQVLQAYTEQVLSTFRNYDLVARYGGEEFAVLLPHTDIYGAERALNKVLQKAVETQLDKSIIDAPINLPTFSAGVASYKNGESIETILERADKAMYNAKKMGRNRVVVEAVD